MAKIVCLRGEEMKKDIILKKLTEEIKRNNLSVFAGAGLSKGAGYQDWKELA